MENSPQKKSSLCPICKKTFEPPPDKYRIFCSERCKLIDLGNWIDEAYAISGDDVVEETEDQEQ